MNRPGNRGTVHAVARALFAERGYQGVTVRDIAAAAGVSPALVVKLHGSKAELYRAAGPVPLPFAALDVPRGKLGAALVRQVLERRDRGATDPWCALPPSVLQSPDPDRTRAEVRERVLGDLAGLIGDTTASRHHAAAVACQLMGFAEGVRVLGLLPSRETDADELVGLYAPAVQLHIDACGGGVPPGAGGGAA